MRTLRCTPAILSAVLLLQPIQAALAQTSATSPAPGFEAAIIKPVKEPDPNRMRDRTEGRRFTTYNTTLRDLLMMAYQLDPRQITGGPAWVATDEYDIDAVAIDDTQLSQHREEMLQKLLADHFHLTFHREPREMSIYALTIAKDGARLKAGDPASPSNSGCQHLGACTFRNDPIAHFARWLQFAVLDRPVVDKTGLTGGYDFTLTWTPDESQFTALGMHIPPPADTPNAPPGLFTAIQEQLGLKLEPQKIPAEVLVIDHVERPSED
jgi:uncharacterized protein (TIGR03435 family)